MKEVTTIKELLDFIKESGLSGDAKFIPPQFMVTGSDNNGIVYVQLLQQE